MGAGQKIIAGLKEALAGNMARVHIDGHTWVRHDAESPEAHLAAARGKVAQLTMRVDELEAALASVVKFAEQADDPEHHTLGLVKHIAIAALQEPVD